MFRFAFGKPILFWSQLWKNVTKNSDTMLRTEASNWPIPDVKGRWSWVLVSFSPIKSDRPNRKAPQILERILRTVHSTNMRRATGECVEHKSLNLPEKCLWWILPIEDHSNETPEMIRKHFFYLTLFPLVENISRGAMCQDDEESWDIREVSDNYQKCGWNHDLFSLMESCRKKRGLPFRNVHG